MSVTARGPDKSNTATTSCGLTCERFFSADGITIVERWHRLYAKHPHEPPVIVRPEPRVTEITGLGGHGMKLLFGLAEDGVVPLVD